MASRRSLPAKLPQTAPQQHPTEVLLWSYSFLMEEPTIEEEVVALAGRVTYFHVRVVCHERRRGKDNKTVGGCKEYIWHLRKRFSDFQELDTQLRDNELLSPTWVMPRKTYWKHLCPSKEFVAQRAQDLLRFLSSVLEAADSMAEAEPERSLTAMEIDEALPRFLGLQQVSNGAPGLHWLPPADAEQRQVSLVYSFDKGTFVWAHHETQVLNVRYVKYDRHAAMGDLSVTHAEGKAPVPSKAIGHFIRRRTETESSSGEASSCTSSLMSSPVASPPDSRCNTPPRRFASGHLPCCQEEVEITNIDEVRDDLSRSVASLSTTTSEPALPGTPRAEPLSSAVMPAVWLQVDVDPEMRRDEEQRRWWESLQQGKIATEVSKVSKPAVSPSIDIEGRRRANARLERHAALFREVAMMREALDLHPILGFGGDGRQLAIVQPAVPTSLGLRGFTFAEQRCHQVLGQVLKALSHLHAQLVPHGHLSPESLLIKDTMLGPQVKLAWTPGQRRLGVPATLGFRGPGPPCCPAGDIWALACVVLVWWSNFEPAPHPWTQFAGSNSLQKNIRDAMARQPPDLPKAFLDLHVAVTTADEPLHSFSANLANLLTMCLACQPEDRPSAVTLLEHAFFEQAL
mmetsp:Transcript_138581/g.276264  ORF Transcript_138581/g.276264 Transcript_138581/m.276264 type:complete len:628 (+) Transcript_138581:40-1923(+)